MTYIDTSVLVAYYCPEPISEKVDQTITDLEKPVISLLVEVELLSALSRKIRESELSFEDANSIKSRFRSHIKQGLYRVMQVQAEHFQMARDWIAQFNSPLRTLDALHLAISWSNGLSLLTNDFQLAESAKKFGIKAKVIGKQ